MHVPKKFTGMEIFMQIENKLISSASQCYSRATSEDRTDDAVQIKDEVIP